MSATPGGFGALFAVRREERAQVAYAVGAFFCVLFSIFLLRPLRDAVALVGGAENLKYLWAVTLLGTIVASLAFAQATSRLPRRRFFALTFRSVALVWLAFIPALPKVAIEPSFVTCPTSTSATPLAGLHPRDREGGGRAGGARGARVLRRARRHERVSRLDRLGAARRRV